MLLRSGEKEEKKERKGCRSRGEDRGPSSHEVSLVTARDSECWYMVLVCGFFLLLNSFKFLLLFFKAMS